MVVEPVAERLRGISQVLHERLTPQSAEGDDSKRWITVTEAARISGFNKGVISRVANTGGIKTNGKSGRARRLDTVEFSQWLLERSPTAEPISDPAEIEKRAREVRRNRGIKDD